jgi:RNA polymerase sigma factor (TIGR02999 family)
VNIAITEILDRHRRNPEALGRALIPVVYDVLKRMAVDRMRRERRRLTMQPTALVNEAYLRLFGEDVAWENRRHFFGAAAEAMRRILIEQARSRARSKRGSRGVWSRADPDTIASSRLPSELLDLHVALQRFERREPRKATVVKLRYFLGLSILEVAEVLGVSPGTVKLDWAFAKAWLWRELGCDRERKAETL